LESDPENPEHHLLRPQVLDENDVPLECSEEDFHDTKIHVWPSDDATTELFDILSPGGSVGQIEAVADESSILYMTEPSSRIPCGQSAIVLINFDPAWGHEGLIPLHMDPLSHMMPMKVGLDSHYNVPRGKKRSSPIPLDLGEEQSVPSKKQKGIAGPSSAPQREPQPPPVPRFMAEEPAMYTVINRGYWLR